MATDTLLPFHQAQRRRSMGRAATQTLSTVAMLALGVGLIGMAGRNLDLAELQAGLAAVRYWPLVFAAVVLMGGPLVLAVEWRIILRGGGENSLGVGKLARMTIATLFWQNICHFALGYGYALHRFVHREKIRPAAALGVVSIDQLAEGIAKALFSASLVFYFAAPQRATTLLPTLFAAAIVGYFAMRPLLKRGLARLSMRAERSSSGRKRLVSGAMIERFGRMWNERAVWTCVALALFKKKFRVAAAFGVQIALGLDLPWIAPFVFIAVLDCATLVPLIPGHMGVYEATAAATYVRFGAGDESALLVGVLYHAAFLVAAIVPAVIVTATRLLPQPAAVPEPIAAEIAEIETLQATEVVAVEGMAA